MTFPSEDDAMLDATLSGYYREQRLPAQVRERLLDMAAASPRRKERRWPRLAAVAAVALALIAVLTFFLPRSTEVSPYEIAESVAAHHLMRKPSQYHATDVVMLGNAMPRLDFTPHWPAALAGWQPTGAKYCSVGGNIAMQLALEAKGSNRQATLYIARQLPQLALSDEMAFRLDEVGVRMWQEQGLFFGLAQDLAAEPSPGF